MLHLTTGKPGAGKTLYTVSEVLPALLSEKIKDKHGQPVARRLCVGGIPELLIDHALVEVPDVDPEGYRDAWGSVRREPGDPPVEWVRVVYSKDEKGRESPLLEAADAPADGIETRDIKRVPMSGECWWLWCRPGDVVVLDECQRLFRPFASGRRVPQYVAKLERHRHYGIDMVFITQHPNLIHSNVRALINKHRNVRRMFGGAQTMCFEWDRCSTSVENTKDATSIPWRHKKGAFGLYKSAELHTKTRFSIPVPLILAVCGFLVLPMALWYAYSRLSSITDPSRYAGNPGVVASAGAPNWADAVVARDPVQQGDVSGVDPSGGSAVAVAVAASASRLAGCIVAGARCRCFDQSGMVAAVQDDRICREIMTPGAVLPLDASPVVAESYIWPASSSYPAPQRLRGDAGRDDTQSVKTLGDSVSPL